MACIRTVCVLIIMDLTQMQEYKFEAFLFPCRLLKQQQYIAQTSVCTITLYTYHLQNASPCILPCANHSSSLFCLRQWRQSMHRIPQVSPYYFLLPALIRFILTPHISFNGKPCASTTRYWDGQMGACGCGTGNTNPFSWQWNKPTGRVIVLYLCLRTS